LGNGIGQRRILVEHQDLRRAVAREGFAKRTSDALGAPRHGDNPEAAALSIPEVSKQDIFHDRHAPR
jgi:hypothetical protein